MALFGENSTIFDKVIDVLHGISLCTWLWVVYMDWKYFNVQHLDFHSHIFFGIIYSFLFLRFTQGLDFGRMAREYRYPPRVIVSILGTANGAVLIDYLLQIYTKMPEYIKPEYWAVSGFVIFFAFFSAVYSIYALARLVFGPSKEQHMEFNDEIEMKAK